MVCLCSRDERWWIQVVALFFGLASRISSGGASFGLYIFPDCLLPSGPGCEFCVPWLCRGCFSPSRFHFFQDLSWSNRRVSARVCRSFLVSLCRLFALRTAYSNTFEASILSVRVDFVCRSLNREAFFSSVAGEDPAERMDYPKEFIAIGKSIMLEKGNYGHWKVKMRALIRGLGKEAWIATSVGWKPPVTKGEDGKDVIKSEDQWTDAEEKTATANSKALSLIFNSVNQNQFKRIQNCESTKDAWDKLAKAYEGTSSVKRSRIDMLASQFENLTMDEMETIEEFSGKISAIASEAHNLGKQYKDKKLVKKLLRCLPSRFESKRTAMGTSLDTDTIEFEEVVGMLQAYELEITTGKGGSSKGLALTASGERNEIQELKDEMSLMAKNFNRAIRRVEKRGFARGQGADRDRDRSGKRNEVQCRECQGYGHIKAECPSLKRKELKCSECKGTGHSKFDCVGSKSKPERSYIVESDSESEDDDSDDDVKGFVSFVGIIEENSDSDVEDRDSIVQADDESEMEKDLDVDGQFRKMYDNWCLLSKEKIAWMEEKLAILELNEKLKADLALENQKNSELVQRLGLEEENVRVLTQELSDTRKKIHMLNSGTKDLDSILASGRTGKSNFGLGYQGGETSGKTNFVPSKAVPGVRRFQNQTGAVPARRQYKNFNHSHYHRSVKGYECYYCGRHGHIQRFCYRYAAKVNQLKRQGKLYPHQHRASKMYVKRDDLYCHVAYTSAEAGGSRPWYFDSGASRHMTGSQSNLNNYTTVKESKVTFGGGAKGRIRGKGDLTEAEKPQLTNVYFVEGLTANLISVSQLCDEGLTVSFNRVKCWATDEKNQNALSGVRTGNNCYMWEEPKVCFRAEKDDPVLWHQRLGHMNVRSMSKLVNKEMVRGVPELKHLDKIVCSACNQGKQIRVQHKKVEGVQTTQVLDLIHMDLMGPMQTESIAGKRYVFVLVDDFSRYTWVRFIREKSETANSFKILALQLKNEKKMGIKQIRSDRGGEFLSEAFNSFCESQGIFHQYSAPRTPQSNGVVERKNRTLQEMARAMIHGNGVPEKFWADAISTACYVINRVYVRLGSDKTPYEIWKGKKPNLSYFRVFGCVCYIMNDKDQLGKFDSRSEEGFFLGYATNSLAYRVWNKRRGKIEESMNVVFDDGSMPILQIIASNSGEAHNSTPRIQEVEGNENQNVSEANESEEESDEEVHSIQVHRNHSAGDVIGDLNGERVTRGIKQNYRQMASFAGFEEIMFSCFVSMTEPKNVKEALVNVIGTKWIFKNKSDEEGNIIRNKARLVAQGYTQVEGLDYDETFAPVARLECIRFLLGTSCGMGFKLQQMDVKSAFLNGIIQEEVYVEQPKGFESLEFPDHVFKLEKALYGLKQAPRAWYERLTTFLTVEGYVRGSVDKTLFVKRDSHGMIIIQIYVDDIVFGGTSDKLVKSFVKAMTTEFRMSMVGELKYFLGLQVNQTDEGITISQSTYAQNLVKRFGMCSSKSARTPMSTTMKLSKDEAGEKVDEKAYRGMIGSLLYLTASRPDLCLSVGLCARYQANPKASHLAAVKRIVKYVKGTVNYWLSYTRDTSLALVGYCDADWAGNLDDRRSTTGGELSTVQLALGLHRCQHVEETVVVLSTLIGTCSMSITVSLQKIELDLQRFCVFLLFESRSQFLSQTLAMARTRAAAKRPRLELNDSDSSIEEVPPKAARRSSSSAPPPAAAADSGPAPPDKSVPSSSKAAGHKSAPSSSHPPINDPVPDLLKNFMKTRGNVPYDSSDRCSMHRYHQAKRDAADPSIWKPPYAPMNIRFLTSQGIERYKDFTHREFHDQRYVPRGPASTAEMMKLIEENHLSDTVSEIDPYVKEVVLEFYSNFHIFNEVTKKSPVFVRGKMYEFSPQMINKAFRTPAIKWHAKAEYERAALSKHALAKYLSEGKVVTWKDLRTPVMPTHLAGLYLICCINWLPSKNNSNVTIDRAKLLYLINEKIPFNYGKLVYDQVEKAARFPGQILNILPFPNLIYRVLMFQREITLENFEKPDPPPKKFNPEVRGGIDHPRRRGEYVFGTSLPGDLRHASTLLLNMAVRLEGGDYGIVQPSSGQSQGVNVDAEAQGSEPEADDSYAEPVDEGWPSENSDSDSFVDSLDVDNEEGFEDTQSG
ncbi:Ribonuclease H-like superfamily [Arabidopsis suecica]|uniref:Ribonuclease H-like superfamily n=1 Tax=Arabidopsis suecica TaxID=45249 RepID=A0A8T2CMQ2_ARASU|nr:Ribonuclease H-like superfamily [Arabidopsis suecica]